MAVMWHRACSRLLVDAVKRSVRRNNSRHHRTAAIASNATTTAADHEGEDEVNDFI